MYSFVKNNKKNVTNLQQIFFTIWSQVYNERQIEMRQYISFIKPRKFDTAGTVKTLNIGTPRPATVVVLNMKQFNFTMK